MTVVGVDAADDAKRPSFKLFCAVSDYENAQGIASNKSPRC